MKRAVSRSHSRSRSASPTISSPEKKACRYDPEDQTCVRNNTMLNELEALGPRLPTGRRSIETPRKRRRVGRFGLLSGLSAALSSSGRSSRLDFYSSSDLPSSNFSCIDPPPPLTPPDRILSTEILDLTKCDAMIFDRNLLAKPVPSGTEQSMDSLISTVPEQFTANTLQSRHKTAWLELESAISRSHPTEEKYVSPEGAFLSPLALGTPFRESFCLPAADFPMTWDQTQYWDHDDQAPMHSSGKDADVMNEDYCTQLTEDALRRNTYLQSQRSLGNLVDRMDEQRYAKAMSFTELASLGAELHTSIPSVFKPKGGLLRRADAFIRG